DEGTGADRLGDLGVGIDQPLLLAHDEKRIFRRGQRQQHRSEWFLQPDLETLRPAGDDLFGVTKHRLAGRDAGSPTLDRGDGVLALDRGTVAELQLVAQSEAPDKLVRAERI